MCKKVISVVASVLLAAIAMAGEEGGTRAFTPWLAEVGSLTCYADSQGIVHALITEAPSDPPGKNRAIWIASGRTALGEPRDLTEDPKADYWDACITQDGKGMYWMAFCRLKPGEEGRQLYLSSSPDTRTWSTPREVKLNEGWKLDRPRLRYEDGQWILANHIRWQPSSRAAEPRLMFDQGGMFWLVFRLDATVYLTNSWDGENWGWPVELGTGRGGIAVCEGRYYQALVAFGGQRWEPDASRLEPLWRSQPGVLLAEVSRSREFEQPPTWQPTAHVQPVYGWPTANWQPLAIRRDPDDWVVVFSAAGKNVVASLSKDMKQWQHGVVAEPAAGAESKQTAVGVCVAGQDLVVVSAEGAKLFMARSPLTGALRGGKPLAP